MSARLPPSDHLLRTMAAVPVASRVLDLGCGNGRHAVPLAQLGFDIWACDVSKECVERVRRCLAPLVGSAGAACRVTSARPEALGYPDDHFDWVVAYGAYDQAGDAAGLVDMLLETMRVLRPGGWVFAAMRSSRAHAELNPVVFDGLFAEAGFARAEASVEAQDPEPVVRGIYRRVTGDTIA